ncbi:hypothetical protein GOBAR_AA27615 [Gossypium barbadense]|uniref:Uncharacterized protein n=1 Tax=Gossypium barbadense TaxID=3634 RepID=A0A2P5WPQ3_GOSBA|nr:hypothetical protein GOBAR_AA27615 [Gossypium barbadense]
MNKGREEVNNNDPKQMPNSAKFLKGLLSNKRKLDATLHVELNIVCSGDDVVTLQACDLVKTPKTQDNATKTVDDKTNIQSSLQEPPRTKTIETVGDAVLLDAIDPHIVTTTPNEEIPLTVLSIFLFGIVEVSHPKFGTFKEEHGRGIENHRRARDKARFYFFDTGILIGRRESTSVVTTHGAYCLWCMANAHVTDLAYFIAFAIFHQTERHRKGVISIGPYMTCLARHFGLLNTAAQSSALTLIGQMSPEGIMTMIHMRMIERQHETDPPQYCLSHAIDEEDLEDIPDDVLP